jgi:hypothetical protein
MYSTPAILMTHNIRGISVAAILNGFVVAALVEPNAEREMPWLAGGIQTRVSRYPDREVRWLAQRDTRHLRERRHQRELRRFICTAEFYAKGLDAPEPLCSSRCGASMSIGCSMAHAPRPSRNGQR